MHELIRANDVLEWISEAQRYVHDVRARRPIVLPHGGAASRLDASTALVIYGAAFVHDDRGSGTIYLVGVSADELSARASYYDNLGLESDTPPVNVTNVLRLFGDTPCGASPQPLSLGTMATFIERFGASTPHRRAPVRLIEAPSIRGHELEKQIWLPHEIAPRLTRGFTGRRETRSRRVLAAARDRRQVFSRALSALGLQAHPLVAMSLEMRPHAEGDGLLVPVVLYVDAERRGALTA
jgi:hypothetical protein